MSTTGRLGRLELAPQSDVEWQREARANRGTTMPLGEPFPRGAGQIDRFLLFTRRGRILTLSLNFTTVKSRVRSLRFVPVATIPQDAPHHLQRYPPHTLVNRVITRRKTLDGILSVLYCLRPLRGR
jgi:hypothetical protein